jgi:arginine/lysine/ornithine decarboxylase
VGEDSLRERIRTHPLVQDKERHKTPRPFRLACIQPRPTTARSTTSARLEIGHLCDYVLWDEAWIGYNAFHRSSRSQPDAAGASEPEMPGCSPQSVHKQGAGFSQASQIHKRDDHIRVSASTSSTAFQQSF